MKTFLAIFCIFLAAWAHAGESDLPRRELIEREELEERVANALVCGYAGDWRGVEREYIFMRELDRRRRQLGEPTTGLADNIRDISYGRFEKRSQFLRAQKQAMSSEVDDNLRAKAKYRLKTDEMLAANELLMDDTYNRSAFILNNLIRSGTLALMGYFPAVIDAGMNIVLNMDRLTQLTIREKKALILYQRYVEKYPDSKEAGKLKKKIEKLKKKVEKHEYAEAIREGKEAYSGGKWESARALFGYAAELRPQSAEPGTWLEKTSGASRARREALERSLEAHPEHDPLSDDEAVQDLLTAGLLGRPDIMIVTADPLLEDGRSDGIDDEARYIIAVAHDMSGAHEEAVSMLKTVTRKHRKSNMARHARLALSNPDYHRYSVLQEAQTDYWLDTLNYVISGQHMAKTSAIAAPGRIISQGATALQTLGLYNALGIAVRSYAAGMKNPVSDQEIIARGEEYLVRYPESKRAESVHRMLAAAYERRAEYNKAIAHYRLTGEESDKKIRRLEEKRAAQWLAFADQAEEKQESFYQAVISEYPETKAAPRAIERLEELERKTRKWSIDKEDLKSSPAIRAEEALCLGEHLFDGDPANGELDESGVFSPRERTVAMQIVTELSRQNISLEMGPERYARVTAMIDDIQYRENLRRYRPAKRGDIVPVELHGTVGSRGIHVYPRLKQRKYKEDDRELYE